MPFKSEKQRRFLWRNEPDVAKRWAQHEKNKRNPYELVLKKRGNRGRS